MDELDSRQRFTLKSEGFVVSMKGFSFIYLEVKG